ncbi:hypothetical protein EJ06DRAFT_355816 [Trichodelitschia bisporula]|uniref:Uncharacterized protein n=1 Tax=Trichodelitschia bisporula TaxID=703511 RepID=A0A6G1I0W0_9PEZI|nr:hypothetical protein EJ06DRAFT_355816 [Trichodelitschia bisporula]
MLDFFHLSRRYVCRPLNPCPLDRCKQQKSRSASVSSCCLLSVLHVFSSSAAVTAGNALMFNLFRAPFAPSYEELAAPFCDAWA